MKPLSLSSFWHWHVKGFSSKLVALKVNVPQDRKNIIILQVRPCIFQFTKFYSLGQ